MVLGDLLNRNAPLPLGALAGPVPEVIKGPIAIDTLVEELATKDSFVFPTVFARARQLVKAQGHDVMLALRAGMEELQVHFFPAITYRNINKKRIIRWDARSWWEVLRPGAKPNLQSRAAHYTAAACIDLERHGLTWAKNIQVYQDHAFPWMEMVLHRLPSDLPQQRLLPILTYISALGMLANGDYVVYTELHKLRQ